MAFGPILRQLFFAVIYPAIKPIIKSYSDKIAYRVMQGMKSGNYLIIQVISKVNLIKYSNK